MNYVVRWKRAARDRLAEIWVGAADRDAVTASADYIEDLLGRDPHSAGESRSGSWRLLFIRPLAVAYKIDDAARKVTVLSVRYVP